jgi:hypothetical protein
MPLLQVAMTYRLLGLLVFSLLLLTGCDSSDSTEAGDSVGPLIPLDEGNTWLFEGLDNFVNEATIRVGGNTTINGVSYREVKVTATTTSEFIPTLSETYVAREQDNSLYIARPDTAGSDIRLFGFELQTSLSEGDTYVHTDERGEIYDVSVSKQAVTVPAGSYDVLVYRAVRQFNDATDLAFIAPGVGPVQLDYQGATLRLVSTNVQ